MTSRTDADWIGEHCHLNNGQKGDENLLILREAGGPTMSIAAATYSKTVRLCVLHKILYSKDSGGDERIFGDVLDRSTPILEREVRVHLFVSMLDLLCLEEVSTYRHLLVALFVLHDFGPPDVLP